ncbi:Flp pilus assembly protein TadG [Nocardiopsis sp. Huas11]|uniref:TadE/TadG family type IV pilus assembly protein n=1 Tax=Nocardiopsis sp. Huas11 TaxID=2183912 RepID=UPI000F267DE3|nr:TadE/TadG family type IV pilus assembly protein [Nocardiopsis sp. Huas11]RKS08317.1 Flp pilus assembly protein TadG [Nocardiopsis sp. Huas11]
MRKPYEDDRGAASVELALLTPMMIGFALLVILTGRVIGAGAIADEAAHAAARAASLERSVPAAEAGARGIAERSLAASGLTCSDHTLALDHGGLQPGGAVTAVLDCRVGLDDLSGLGVPGNVTVQGSSTVAVDTFRGQP